MFTRGYAIDHDDGMGVGGDDVSTTDRRGVMTLAVFGRLWQRHPMLCHPLVMSLYHSVKCPNHNTSGSSFYHLILNLSSNILSNIIFDFRKTSGFGARNFFLPVSQNNKRRRSMRLFGMEFSRFVCILFESWKTWFSFSAFIPLVTLRLSVLQALWHCA